MISEYNAESDRVIIYYSTKRCITCGEIKEEPDFSVSHQNTDGIHSYCRKCAAAKSRINYRNNKERCNKKSMERYNRVKHTPQFKERRRAIDRYKWNNDLKFRSEKNLRDRIRHALKNGLKKTNKYSDLLGCRPRQAVYYLTNGGCEIPRGMHVDHYVPVSFFDLSNLDQQKVCFNWRNLRLLTATENIRKHDRLPFDYKERVALICAAIGVTNFINGAL